MDQDDDEFLYGDHSTTVQPPPATAASLPGLSVGAPPPAHQDTAPTAPAQPPQASPEELEEGEEEEEEVEVSDDEDVRSPSSSLGRCFQG
jgi:hypothetical protein